MNFRYLATAILLVGWPSALRLPVHGATVEYTLVIEGAWVNVTDANGASISREGTLINGSLPGPLITAQEGDTLVIRVINTNVSQASLHWHGMQQPGTPFMDGTVGVTSCALPPNSEERIEFQATPAGTHWYHSHSMIPYDDGQYGPLIVYPREHMQAWEDEVDEEFVVMLHEWSSISSSKVYEALTTGASMGTGGVGGMDMGATTNPGGVDKGTDAPANTGGMGGMSGMAGMTRAMDMNAPGVYDGIMESDVAWPTMMINGKATGTEFPVESGKTYRFRLIHAGASYSVNVSVASPLQMELVMVDPGTYLKPTIVDYIGVEIGARYDFLITPQDDLAPGSYPIYITDYTGVNIATPATIVVNGNTTDMHPSGGPITTGRTNTQFFPFPASNSSIPAAARLINLTLTGTDMPYTWGINSISAKHPSVPIYISGGQFGMEPGQIVIESLEVNEVVDILLDNSNTMMTHSFHLHGNQFYVLGSREAMPMMSMMNDHSGRDLILNDVNPVIRDTVNVPANGMTMIRLVANNPGPWIMHCHLDLHFLAGMSLVIMVGNTDDWAVPKQEIRLCGSTQDYEAMQQFTWSQQFLAANMSDSNATANAPGTPTGAPIPSETTAATDAPVIATPTPTGVTIPSGTATAATDAPGSSPSSTIGVPTPSGKPTSSALSVSLVRLLLSLLVVEILYFIA